MRFMVSSSPMLCGPPRRSKRPLVVPSVRSRAGTIREVAAALAWPGVVHAIAPAVRGSLERKRGQAGHGGHVDAVADRRAVLANVDKDSRNHARRDIDHVVIQ